VRVNRILEHRSQLFLWCSVLRQSSSSSAFTALARYDDFLAQNELITLGNILDQVGYVVTDVERASGHKKMIVLEMAMDMEMEQA
jgi:hypothetical protein